MLEYRENVNYCTSAKTNVDDQIVELCELIREDNPNLYDQVYAVYTSIRAYIYKEIKVKELAITTILNDLNAIRKTKPKTANIIELFIVYNYISYQQLAKMIGCTKQNVYSILKRYAENYRWLKTLMQIKGEEDCRNQMNRSIKAISTKKPKKEKPKKEIKEIKEITIQLELFD